MKTIFDLHEQLNAIRQNDRDVFGVEYYSKSNASTRHYVVMATECEYENFKAFYEDYDFTFNRLAI
jgi:hypothetical protein